MKVVYGHTDSIYVECESIEKGKKIVEHLNTEVRKLFPNVLKLDEHPVQLEFEKYFKSLGVGLTKNRNAGMITWKDGKYLNEDEFVMTGFTAKRQTNTQLGRETQLKILKMWVNEVSGEKITDVLHELYYSVLNGKIPVSLVLSRTRYKPSRFKVVCNNCKRNKWKSTFSLHELMKRKQAGRECCDQPDYVTLEGKRPMIGSGIEGVLFHDFYSQIPITDSYLYLRIVDAGRMYPHPFSGKATIPNYFSCSTVAELESHDYIPDWRHYAESIIKKALPIYGAMGWDVMNIKKDRNQRDLLEWLV